MTVFQLLMLGASAFFAFKIFQHIQTLQDPESQRDESNQDEIKSAEAFSPFEPEALVEKADAAFVAAQRLQDGKDRRDCRAEYHCRDQGVSGLNRADAGWLCNHRSVAAVEKLG